MTDYAPRPGSKAEAAAWAIQAAPKGELSTADLADEIDCDSGTIAALLAWPLKHGYFARTLREGINWWSMGDGTPPAAEPDDDPPVQRTVPAPRGTAIPVPKKKTKAKRRPPPTPRAAPATPRRPRQVALTPARAPALPSIAPPAPPPGAPALSVAVFNTGELLLEVPGQQPLRLDGQQTADLLRWLQRVQPTIATEPA